MDYLLLLDEKWVFNKFKINGFLIINILMYKLWINMFIL